MSNIPAAAMPVTLSDYRRLWLCLRRLPQKEIRSHARHLCRLDLFFLLRYGLRRMDVENQWILDRCREVQSSPDGHLDLWAREHYKSTIITFALIIQNILQSHGRDRMFSEELTFCILSHNRPTAKAFLRQIKSEFETNKLLASWFPDVLYSDPKKQSPKWSEDEGIVVRRESNPKESTVEAYGLVDGMPTGRHYHVLNYDDVVTERSVTTVDMIRKTTEMFRLSINLGREGGVKRYIGTRYDSDDTYYTMLEDRVAEPRIHAATDNGQAEGNPVLMSEAYLTEKRKMGPYLFSCQMLQDPVPNEDAYFDMGEVQRYDQPPPYLTRYMASDYAVTEDGGDWTVHGVFGIDPDEHIWVLDWWRGRTRSDVWVESACDLLALHQPATWFEEKGVIHRSVEPFLTKRMRERRTYVKRDGIPADRNKAARARSMQGRVQMGMLHIPEGVPWADDLLLEMKRFPFTTVDDQVDVLSIIGLGVDKIYGAFLPELEPSRQYNSGAAVMDALRTQTNGHGGRYG